MTDQTRKCLEVVEEEIEYHKRVIKECGGNDGISQNHKSILEALTHLISEIQRYNTPGELPERKECLSFEDVEKITQDKMQEYETYKYGFNSCLDLITPLYNALKEKIKELRTGMFEIGEKVSQEYQRRMIDNYVPKTIAEELRKELTETKEQLAEARNEFDGLRKNSNSYLKHIEKLEAELNALKERVDDEKIADVLDIELPWLREDLLKLANKIKVVLLKEAEGESPVKSSR